LTPHTFTKWTGLALDGLIYLWACVLLWKLVMTLYGSRYNAAATVALYGLSTIGLSTMVMIRMYVLMTALTVLLALQVAQLVKKPRPLLYPLIGLTIFLGLMTQYYFVFYAFFLCAGYVFYALFRIFR
ncbi:MAG: glycosyltransferase family 39 protein, partial [Bacteroidaceae bacterium]|nr:glycosyltransferase family 39 protein [Bacteroidaceae bacterium]